MRIASWNVDSVRARRDLVAEWLDRDQPSVVCLQETKASARVFPRQLFDRRGFELVCTDERGGQGGVALASRVGLDDAVVGIPGARRPLHEQRSISATVNGIRLHTVYGPNGRKVGTRHHEIKLAWLRLFTAWIGVDGLAEGAPTMVIGDLNVAPSDIDVWDADRYRKRNLTSPAERAVFGDLLGAGLVDLVRTAHRENPVFTWWNRRGDFYETDRGWRLDHALADPKTADRVEAVTVDRDLRGRPGSSDHAPLTVQLGPDLQSP